MRKFPLEKGLCASCPYKDKCPMNDILETHKKNMEELGENYYYIDPALWDKYALEEPEVENDEVVYCPMHFNC